MSCLKIIFILTNFFLVIALPVANAKEPRQVIVATVDNHFITAQDVLNATNRLPKKIKEKPLSEIYPNIVNELINQHLITKQAYKDKLDQQKEIVEILKKNKDEIMAKYWLNSFLTKNTSEEKIQNFYAKYLENFKTFKEFNASHILVKEEDEALQIIEKLKIKSEFSELAKSYSIGPSKENGGSLGWFRSGQIAEMKTGEGKTLVATLACYLNALEGKGVHVVTVNDYLARRDSEWMGQIYNFLGMTVGCIISEMDDEQRRIAYNADITYGTNNEFGFDYLRDNMKYNLADMVQRPFNFAIVDEVDSILIDEARTPLINWDCET